MRDLHGTFQAKRGARSALVPAPLPRKVRAKWGMGEQANAFH